MDEAPQAKRLSEAKRALLAQRLAGRKSTLQDRAGAFPALEQGAERRASLGQETIWLLNQASDDRSAYNITSSFQVGEGLDLDRLETSVREVRSRHEILRSVYREGDGYIEQLALDGEWTGIERWEVEGDSELAALEARLACAPLDVAEGPLWRIHHVAARPGPSLLMLVIHDLISDKWSILQFWKEVGGVYNALAKGHTPRLEAVERQFADFAAWQRERVEGASGSRQLEYWKEKLRAPPAPLPLPTDRPYPSSVTMRGRLASGRVSTATTARLRALAASEDASVFMVSLLAFQLLLQRLAGVDDVVIASPVANRRTSESASMLGFLLSTVALRTRLDDGPTVREALRRTRETVLGALAHQDMPLDRIVEAVKPPRVAGRHTLAQVMFVYQRQTEAQPPLQLDGVEVTNTLVETGTSKFDLSLFVAESDEGFETIAEYRTDLFDPETVERWLDYYARLLEALVVDPERSVGALEFLPAGERELRQATVALPASEFRTVIDAIQSQATSVPDAIALRGSGRAYSYEQLWEWSGRIAGAIERSAHTPERVGLLLEKGPVAVAGILGILRTGAAYVALDPTYPESRNRAVIEDAGLDALLVSAESIQAVGATAPVPMVEVAECEQMPESPRREHEWNPEGLAYLLYTSGSTGTPKGVEVTHPNLWASTRARNAVYGSGAAVFLLLPSLAFDSSVAGLFWTLSNGGTLVLPTAEELRDPEKVVALIDSTGVTASLGIPSLYGELLAAGEGRMGSLKQMIVAGESCPPGLVGRHFQALPECALHNEYGPTEATVWATVHACGKGDAGADSVPIGRPVPGAAIHLLDPAGRDVPIGVEGEIWIGGAGVAHGYRNHGTQMAERFQTLPGRGRLYRSGDRGRWRPDGALEFAGRMDGQIKLNGHRVELGEIEAILEAHPAVSEAIVTLNRDGPPPSSAEADALIETLGPRVPQPVMEKWLQEFAKEREDGPDRIVRREKFHLDLHVMDPSLIQPPRKRQRDWILGQAMEEFASDLEHLDRVAAKFVTGHDHQLGEELKDITQAVLSADEIMEDWMTPIMRAMANYAAQSHGDVLEIGFGRGVAAEMIQEAGVKSHHVVEMNDHSVKHYFEPWRARHADRAIELFHGRWQDVESSFGTYDGILFHTFPMNEEEFEEYVLKSVTFAEHAFARMARLLRPGGIFTYMTIEIDSLSRRHQRALLQHFSAIEFKVEPLEVPSDTRDTWWSDSMVVIKAVK